MQVCVELLFLRFTRLPDILLILILILSVTAMSDDDGDAEDGDEEDVEMSASVQQRITGLIGEHKPMEQVPVLIDNARSSGTVLQLSVLMGPAGKNISVMKRDRIRRGRQDRK